MEQSERQVRGVRLLSQEEPCLALDSRRGLLEAPSPQGDLLLLTSRRVARFTRQGERQRTILAALEEIGVVEVSDPLRSIRPLAQGGGLMIAGLVAAALAYAMGFPTPLALALGAALLLLGIFRASTYVAAEEPATLVFRATGQEIVAPLYTVQARRDAAVLIRRVFELKRDLATQTHLPEEWPPLPLQTLAPQEPATSPVTDPEEAPPLSQAERGSDVDIP